MKSPKTRTRLACASLLVATATTAWADNVPSPLTLRQAVDAALAGNPALQAFAFEFRVQDARARQAALRPAPSVSLELENVLGTGDTRGTRAAESTFALSQIVELGGKRDARIGAAGAARGVLEIERQARQLDVLAEVTRRFIAVAARQEEAKLGRRAVELAQRAVDGAERRVNAARSPHAELDRARISLDRARLAERATSVELDTARKQLAATWGDTEARIAGQPIGEIQADMFQLPAMSSFAELTSRLAGSPDFLRFASEARLRDAELRIATTLRRPDIALGGGVRQLQASGDRALIASVSVPLFGKSRAESFVAEAQARRDLVDSDSRAARVKAEATLYELHHQLERAVSEATALKADILPRTEEALGETEYAYERGRYSYLELVDAQRESLEVQAALIEAAAGAHALQVEIERLTNAPLTSGGAQP